MNKAWKKEADSLTSAQWAERVEKSVFDKRTRAAVARIVWWDHSSTKHPNCLKKYLDYDGGASDIRRDELVCALMAVGYPRVVARRRTLSMAERGAQ